MDDSRLGPGATLSANPDRQSEIKFRTFVCIVLLLVGLGTVRSRLRPGWTGSRSTRHITLPPEFPT
jgi:hypothetical protein